MNTALPRLSLLVAVLSRPVLIGTLRLRSGQAPSASLRAGSFGFAQGRFFAVFAKGGKHESMRNSVSVEGQKLCRQDRHACKKMQGPALLFNPTSLKPGTKKMKKQILSVRKKTIYCAPAGRLKSWSIVMFVAEAPK
jgi:hypothetical protein